MNFVTQLKFAIKLLPLFLITMLDAAHSSSEATSLINHTKMWVYGTKYEPTLWSFLLTLLVTFTAFGLAIRVILNVKKSYN
jgi:uncharacterized membrane protein